MSAAGSGERGFIVVAVLWILAALAALVTIYLNFVTGSAVVTAANIDRPQIEALATAGVELAAYRMLSSDNRPAQDRFDAQVGPHRIAVSFIAESARIDLNAAPKVLLAGLFAALGAGADASQSYAARIAAWRTPAGDDVDTETPLYRAAGVAYAPRRGPFPVADELWLVHGIPEVLIARALPYLTTFSNQPSVDRAIAAPLVVAALPGVTPPPPQATPAQPGEPRETEAAAVSNAFRVSVAVTLAGGQQGSSEAVILLLDGDAEPYRVLSWRNMFEGGAPSAGMAPR